MRKDAKRAEKMRKEPSFIRKQVLLFVELVHIKQSVCELYFHVKIALEVRGGKNAKEYNFT